MKIIMQKTVPRWKFCFQSIGRGIFRVHRICLFRVLFVSCSFPGHAHRLFPWNREWSFTLHCSVTVPLHACMNISQLHFLYPSSISFQAAFLEMHLLLLDFLINFKYVDEKKCLKTLGKIFVYSAVEWFSLSCYCYKEHHLRNPTLFATHFPLLFSMVKNYMRSYVHKACVKCGFSFVCVTTCQEIKIKSPLAR